MPGSTKGLIKYGRQYLKEALEHDTFHKRHLHTVPGGDVSVQDVGSVEEGQAVGGLHCQFHQLSCTQVSSAMLLQVPDGEEVDGDCRHKMLVYCQTDRPLRPRSIHRRSLIIAILTPGSPYSFLSESSGEMKHDPMVP